MASTINASTTSTSGLVYNADASGVLQLQSNGTAGLTVNANASVTVNTVLQTPNGRIEPLVLGTSQTASGTSVDFTGIPSWVKRITVIFSGVSTNGTSDVIVQVGTSTSFVTTGYAGTAFTVVSSASPGASAYSTGVLIRLGGAADASAVRHGTVVLTSVGNNTWLGTVNIGLSNTVYAASGSGTVTLTSELTQVRITTVTGTNTFDAGTVNIMYE